MPPERKQISVWINAESASLLSSIAKEQGQPLARIIELAIAAYSTSDRTSGKTSDYTSDQTSMQLVDYAWRNTIDDLRTLIADHGMRLCAIETAIMSGLDAGSRKVRVSVSAAENEAVEADSDSLSHPADSLSLPPQSPDDFEQLVKNTYKECGEKLRKTMEALRDKGHAIGQKRLYKILGKKAWAG